MENLETMLIPAIIQDSKSKDILMMGYMNGEALKRTIKGPNVWFYSRSKKRLWEKGETSKNYLEVVSITTDCDKDVLLITVDPKGPTCHTGETMCFHDPNLEELKFGNPYIIDEIFEVIENKKINPDIKSYTSKLFSNGNDLISQKVIEELCELNPELSDKYAIDTNKGYGAKKHLEGIKKHGITKWHRKTYGICKNYAEVKI